MIQNSSHSLNLLLGISCKPCDFQSKILFFFLSIQTAFHCITGKFLRNGVVGIKSILFQPPSTTSRGYCEPILPPVYQRDNNSVQINTISQMIQNSSYSLNLLLGLSCKPRDFQSKIFFFLAIQTAFDSIAGKFFSQWGP